MISLIFKNEIGEVVLNGENSIWRTISISGLGLVNKNYNTVSYYGVNGQETISSSSCARAITISGDIICDDIQSELSRAIRIFNSGGEFIIKSKNINRKIYCNQVVFPDCERLFNIGKFVLQFVCDDPFFNDASDNKICAYDLEKNIYETFTLPMVFSTIITECSINNNGDEISYPVFYVSCTNPDFSSQNLIIKNKTTSKQLTMNYSITDGENIIVDTINRKITSNINGNIISYISNDSKLSDMYLKPGVNVIEIFSDETEGLSITCEYKNNYIEAVY